MYRMPEQFCGYVRTSTLVNFDIIFKTKRYASQCSECWAMSHSQRSSCPTFLTTNSRSGQWTVIMTMRNAATERDHAASLAHRQAMSHTLNLFASCVGIYDECRQCRNTCRTPSLLTYVRMQLPAQGGFTSSLLKGWKDWSSYGY